MRGRIIALWILLTVLAIPLLFYWLFFVNRQGNLIILWPKTEYSIILKGTFWYQFFPMVDAVLYFTKDCRDVCEIWPIPSVSYDVTITATWWVDVTNQVFLKSGDNIMYYTPLTKLQWEKWDKNILPQTEDSTYRYLKNLGQDEYLVINTWVPRSIWYLKNDVYQELWILEDDIALEDIRLDSSLKFLLFPETLWTTILSIDFQNEIFFPSDYGSPIAVDYAYKTWKIRTENAVFEWNDGEFLKNVRFSDFVDVSATLRIWCILARDTDKITLSNLSEGKNYYIILNRETGESRTQEAPSDLESLFLIDWQPYYMDSSWEKWKLIF